MKKRQIAAVLAGIMAMSLAVPAMAADETEEYMNEVASFAQQAIVSCGGSASFASTRAIALATINLADQCIKAKREALAAEEKCRALEKELEELRAQKNTAKNGNHKK